MPKEKKKPEKVDKKTAEILKKIEDGELTEQEVAAKFGVYF